MFFGSFLVVVGGEVGIVVGSVGAIGHVEDVVSINGGIIVE